MNASTLPTKSSIAVKFPRLRNLRQDAEPDLYLVQPRSVLGRIVEDHAMRWITQKGSPCPQGIQVPLFVSDHMMEEARGNEGSQYPPV